MNTRRYPRTLNEAFGPYAHGNQIVEHNRPMDWQDRVVLAGCWVCVVAFLLALLGGWVVL